MEKKLNKSIPKREKESETIRDHARNEVRVLKVTEATRKRTLKQERQRE